MIFHASKKNKHLYPIPKLQQKTQVSCPLDWFRDPKLLCCLAVLSEILEELRPLPRSSWAVAASSSFMVAAPPRINGEAFRINPFFLRLAFSNPQVVKHSWHKNGAWLGFLDLVGKVEPKKTKKIYNMWIHGGFFGGTTSWIVKNPNFEAKQFVVSGG